MLSVSASWAGIQPALAGLQPTSTALTSPATIAQAIAGLPTSGDSAAPSVPQPVVFMPSPTAANLAGLPGAVSNSSGANAPAYPAAVVAVSNPPVDSSTSTGDGPGAGGLSGSSGAAAGSFAYPPGVVEPVSAGASSATDGLLDPGHTVSNYVIDVDANVRSALVSVQRMLDAEGNQLLSPVITGVKVLSDDGYVETEVGPEYASGQLPIESLLLTFPSRYAGGQIEVTVASAEPESPVASTEIDSLSAGANSTSGPAGAASGQGGDGAIGAALAGGRSRDLDPAPASDLATRGATGGESESAGDLSVSDATQVSVVPAPAAVEIDATGLAFASGVSTTVNVRSRLEESIAAGELTEPDESPQPSTSTASPASAGVGQGWSVPFVLQVQTSGQRLSDLPGATGAQSSSSDPYGRLGTLTPAVSISGDQEPNTPESSTNATSFAVAEPITAGQDVPSAPPASDSVMNGGYYERVPTGPLLSRSAGPLSPIAAAFSDSTLPVDRHEGTLFGGLAPLLSDEDSLAKNLREPWAGRSGASGIGLVDRPWESGDEKKSTVWAFSGPGGFPVKVTATVVGKPTELNALLASLPGTGPATPSEAQEHQPGPLAEIPDEATLAEPSETSLAAIGIPGFDGLPDYLKAALGLVVAVGLTSGPLLPGLVDRVRSRRNSRLVSKKKLGRGAASEPDSKV